MTDPSARQTPWARIWSFLHSAFRDVGVPPSLRDVGPPLTAEQQRLRRAQLEASFHEKRGRGTGR